MLDLSWVQLTCFVPTLSSDLRINPRCVLCSFKRSAPNSRSIRYLCMRLTKLGRRRQHQREPEVPTAGDQVTTGYEVVEHQGDSQGTYKLELTLPTANFSWLSCKPQPVGVCSTSAELNLLILSSNQDLIL